MYIPDSDLLDIRDKPAYSRFAFSTDRLLGLGTLRCIRTWADSAGAWCRRSETPKQQFRCLFLNKVNVTKKRFGNHEILALKLKLWKSSFYFGAASQVNSNSDLCTTEFSLVFAASIFQMFGERQKQSGQVEKRTRHP